MKCKCLIFSKPGVTEISEYEIHDIQKGQIITKTIFTGVSTGTETRVLAGNENGVNFPLIPGYENIGVVVETSGDNNFSKDDIVFVGNTSNTGPFTKAWGAHVEYAVNDPANLIRIDDQEKILESLYIKISAISLHGIKRAKIKSGDKVVVCGLGIIGNLAAQIASAYGADVLATDISEDRINSLKQLTDKTFNSKNEDIESGIKRYFPQGADVVIDATGLSWMPNKLAHALKDKDWDGKYYNSGKVLLLASYMDPVKFDYHPILFDKEPDIFTSRDTVKEDLIETMKLISSNKIDPKLIDHKIYNFNDASIAYRDLINSKTMRIIFDWRNA